MTVLTFSREFTLADIADKSEAFQDFTAHARMTGMVYESMNAQLFIVLEIMQVRAQHRDDPFYVVILLHPDTDHTDTVELEKDERILITILMLRVDLLNEGINPDEYVP